ncbi:MAG: hypothetical protein KTR15_09015 [Phycisphaeraceae bacterium]|nr:hypothetical protein [Phycisphaeraceae bacterium]
MLIVLFALLLGAGELFARFYLGLGDPPLSMADPEIEYLFQPSQDVSRFGNRIAFNAYSMRSDALTTEKADDEVLRVLVLGDSIINGGSQTDQSELATELLKTTLSTQLGGKVQVGNISAGSWGPANLLAYLERYGLFNADAVVLVISSHDASDVPTFKPLVGVSTAFPAKKPALALQEAVVRYLPRYLPSLGRSDEPSPAEPDDTADGFPALDDLDALINHIQTAGIPLAVLQHPEKAEIEQGDAPGYQAIAEQLDRSGVMRMDLRPYFRAYLDEGRSVYRDKIHPNPAGQEALAQALYDALLGIGVLEQEHD